MFSWLNSKGRLSRWVFNNTEKVLLGLGHSNKNFCPNRYFLRDFWSSSSKLNCLHTLEKPHISHHLLARKVSEHFHHRLQLSKDSQIPPLLESKTESIFLGFCLNSSRDCSHGKTPSASPRIKTLRGQFSDPHRTKLTSYLEGEQQMWSLLRIETAAEERDRLAVFLSPLLSPKLPPADLKSKPQENSQVLPLVLSGLSLKPCVGQETPLSSSSKSSSSSRKNKTSSKQLDILWLYIPHTSMFYRVN